MSRRGFLGAGLAAAGWVAAGGVGRALPLPIGNPYAPLVLDDFDSDLAVSSPDRSSVLGSNLDPHVIGGERELVAQGPSAADSNVTIPGAFTVAMDPGGLGAYLTWDGRDGGLEHPDGGFGAMDFTRGGTVDAFVLEFASVPFPVPFSAWDVVVDLRSRLFGYAGKYVPGVSQSGHAWTYKIPFSRFSFPLMDIEVIRLIVGTASPVPDMTFALGRFSLGKV